MKNKFYLIIIVFIFLLPAIALSPVFGQAPFFTTVNANNTSIQKGDKFELNINLTGLYSNPFDYNDIAVQCIFNAPGGRKDTVDGFYMQDYTLDTSNSNISTSGAALFKVRYSPNETGNWSYILSCTNTVGITTQPLQTFTCTSSSDHGFIRKNATHYLGFDDGLQYIPIGENMCWQDNNVYTDYTNWLPKLANNGGNFIRIWMSDWAFALEWKNGVNGYGGLMQYKQSSGYWLDWLLDYCKKKGVYMMLCINHHGQVSTTTDAEWINNPYNVANNGPCTNTWDFFTNATAKADLKNRMRYIVARYGYSTNIESWELFNEVEWTDQFSAHKTEITDWHREMSAYLKSKDVNKHLVTTSYAQDVNDPATWNLPDIDFTQTHYYVSAPNIESILSSGIQAYLTQFNKPTITGEFGLTTSGNNLSATDSNGVHIHNAIWATAFSGAIGSAMTWWWDNYINPRNLYYHYKPLSVVLSSLSLKDDQYIIGSATTSGGGAADISISPGSGFGKSPAADFTIDASGKMTPGATQLSSYIFGNIYNTQNRNPPTFHITYPVAGQFKVAVTSGSQGTSPRIDIFLDGAQVFDSIAVPNKTYTINVPAGTHAIKVDNLGTDWVNISNFVFTNAGSPLTTYNLKSANSKKASGWLLNNQYNWKYLQDNKTTPPIVSGAIISVPGLNNGSYSVKLFDCSSGVVSNTLNAVPVTNGTLNFALPDVSWDIAYTASQDAVLPLVLSKFYGENAGGSNKLYIKIATAENLKEISIEKSKDGTGFYQLGILSMVNIPENNIYLDTKPSTGNNYYRLKITSDNGSITYSDVIDIKVTSTLTASVYPNPVKDKIALYLSSAGNQHYEISVMDIIGHVITKENRYIAVGDQVIDIPFEKNTPGIYFVRIKDRYGDNIFTIKISK